MHQLISICGAQVYESMPNSPESHNLLYWLSKFIQSINHKKKKKNSVQEQ